jgi:hypothetical protein
MDSKNLFSDNQFNLNPVYRHMDLKRIEDITLSKINYVRGPGDVFGPGITISPGGSIKYNGKIRNAMYRDVNLHRRDTEKFRHFFSEDGKIGDLTLKNYVQGLTITNKNNTKDYTIHYAQTETDFSHDNAIPVYIEIAPYSSVNIHEHFWKDATCKIFRIVYVLREGTKATINRYYNRNSKFDGTLILESRVIQHPASVLDINLVCRDSFEYIQDLYNITVYKNCVSRIKNRYHCDKDTSIHVVTDINHIGSASVSDIDVKSVTDDRSRFTFAGNIIVSKEAENVDANLQNKNLQLSDNATVVTEPKLDISTKEIACRHGCTVSNIDPEQMYFLNTRGFDNATAKQILTDAFIHG